MTTSGPNEPIAIVGMGCVFPGAFNLDAYWSALLSCDTSAQRLPPRQRWDYRRFFSEDRNAPDKGYSGLGGFIDGFQFQPEPFGLSASDLEGIGEDKYWLITALAECCRDVGRGKNPALILGATSIMGQFNLHLLRQHLCGDLGRFLEVGQSQDNGQTEQEWLFNRIGQTLGIQRNVSAHLSHHTARTLAARLIGENVQPILLDAACVSSLYAIDLGIQFLQAGRADIAYCGGYFCWSPMGQVLFCKLGGYSAHGCFPFDERADGTIFGDGAGVIALKRLSQAIGDGDTIHAVIPGIGIASDGKGKAVYAPNPQGQVQAIRRAFKKTGLHPGDVQYVSAHATGTVVGDATEYQALLSIYGAHGLPPKSIGLGSVKGLFGHLGWAAGVASVIQVALALKARQMPPQANFAKLSPMINLDDGPFDILTQARPWTEGKNGRARCAAVSGFGFGGTDAHLLMTEWRPQDHGSNHANRHVALTAPSCRFALVAAGCVFPAAHSFPEALDIVGRGKPATQLRFKDGYAVNGFRYRMAESAVKVTDPLQFMLLDAAGEAIDQIKDHLPELREKTDLYVGHMSGLTKAISHAKRIYWDGIREDILADAPPDWAARLLKMADAWEEHIRDKIPASSEDSFSGIMPNLLSGRVSNHFDLQGINECINAGRNSFAVAMEVAMESLHQSHAKMALVGATCAPAMVPDQGEAPGEGALVLCLIREQEARAHHMPIIAFLEARPAGQGNCATKPPVLGDLCGATGAEPILAALHAVISRRQKQMCINLGSHISLLVRAVDDDGQRQAPVDDSENKTRRFRPVYLAQPLLDADPAALPEDLLLVCSSPGILERLGDQFKDARILLSAAKGESLSHIDGRACWIVDPEEQAATRQVCEAIVPGRTVIAVMDLAESRPADGTVAPRTEAIYWLLFRLLQKWAAQPLPPGDLSAAIVLANAAMADNGPLLPATGLFSGLMATLSLEMPAAQCKVLHLQKGELTDIRQRIALELADANVSVCYDQKGRRSVFRVCPDPLAVSGDAFGMDRSSVVVAAGGGRGITLAVAQEIVKRTRCTVVILGRSAYDAHNRIAALPERAVFLASARQKFPQASIRELNEKYEALTAAFELQQNLAQLGGLGARIEYRVCDVTDAARMHTVFQEILVEYGRIDLVLYGAGSAGTYIKHAAVREASARHVYAPKVHGLKSMVDALNNYPNCTFLLFGSLASTGMDGMSAYASANHFMNTFAAYRNALEGNHRFRCLNWPAWDEVGIVSRDKDLRRTISQDRRATLIGVEEGRSKAIAELSACSEAVYYLGDNETADRPYLQVTSPENPEPTRHDPARRLFFIDSIYRRSPRVVEIQRVIDLSRDAYLMQHCVDKDPVVPGTFLMEIAAEAALALHPHLKVAGIENARFLRFVKLHGGRAIALKVRAESRLTEGGKTEVMVEIVSDFRSRRGVLLEANRRHFSCKIILGPVLDTAPAPELSHCLPGEADVPDPYLVEGGPILLQGVFDTLAHRRAAPQLAHAVYRNRLCQDEHPFARFVLPPLLMDGTLRTFALAPIRAALLPLYVPVGIEQVEFFTDQNDLSLSASFPTIEIRVGFVAGSIRFEVTNGAGQLLLRIRGVEAHIIGSFDAGTVQYLPADSEDVQLSDINRSPAQADQRPLSVPVSVPEPVLPASVPSTEACADACFGDPVERYQAILTAKPLKKQGTAVLDLSRTIVLANDRDAQDLFREYGSKQTFFFETASQSLPPSDKEDLPGGEALQDTLARYLKQADKEDELLAYFDLRHLGRDPYELALNWPLVEKLMNILYLLGREVSRSGRSLSVVCSNAWLSKYSCVHPLAKSVRGLLASLRPEVPSAAIRLLMTDAGSSKVSLALLAQEREAEESDFATLYVDGERLVEGLAPAADVPQAQAPVLSNESVVLVAGGGRGLGALAAKELYKRWGCRLVLLGRSEPEAAHAAMDDLTKQAFFNAERARDRSAKPVDILHRLKKRLAARELRESLAMLRQQGADVAYYTCNITNQDAVAAVIDDIHRKFGHIDFVLHCAAVEHSALLAGKKWHDFKRVYDSKVQGALNLYLALRSRLPKTFHCFGSMYSWLGTDGQTDYGAANAFLDGFSELLSKAHPTGRWMTLAWPGWHQVGMAARRTELLEVARKRGRPVIGPDQGIALYLKEVTAAQHCASQIVFATPSVVGEAKLLANAAASHDVYPFDSITRKGEDTIIAARLLSQDRDPYLRMHLANGAASMAGAIETAFAVELLCLEFPDWKLHRLYQLQLPKFLKVFDVPVPLRVVAKKLSASTEELRLEVKLRTDFIHKSGRVLKQDRVHWSAKIALCRVIDPAPSERHLLPEHMLALPLPHYQTNAAVHYTPDMHNLIWRKQDQKGLFWGKIGETKDKWHLFSRSGFPYWIIDALSLTVGTSELTDGVLVSTATEQVHIYTEAMDTKYTGALFTQCAPPTQMPDGSFLCPSLRVVREDGTVCVHIKNAKFVLLR